MKSNNNNNSNSYKVNVLGQNASLKKEVASLQGAVRILVGHDDLTADNIKTLRRLAGGKPYTTAQGRNSISVAISNFAKDPNTGRIMQKVKGEFVPRQKFSAFWVLQQLEKIRKQK